MRQHFVSAPFRFTLKKLFSGAIVAGLLACSGGGPQFTDKLETHQDSLSYALGGQTGAVYRVQDVKLEEDAFFQGFMDTYLERSELLPPAARRALVTAHEAAEIRREKMRREEKALPTLESGRQYMLQNGQADSVITTESGLQYKVLTEGEGPHPANHGSVRAHYVARLIDGAVFDSTSQSRGPVILSVLLTVPGMSEALQLMRAGSRWEITIPSELAYGDRSPTPLIKRNSVLIFDLEIVKVIR